MRILICFLLITTLSCAAEERVSELASEIELPPAPEREEPESREQPARKLSDLTPEELETIGLVREVEEGRSVYVHYGSYGVQKVEKSKIIRKLEEKWREITRRKWRESSFVFLTGMSIAIRVVLENGKPATLYVKQVGDVAGIELECYPLNLKKKRRRASTKGDVFQSKNAVWEYYEGKNKKGQVFGLHWRLGTWLGSPVQELRFYDKTHGEFSTGSRRVSYMVVSPDGGGTMMPLRSNMLLDKVRNLFSSCMGKK